MPSIRTFIARLAEPQLLRLLLMRHHVELDADLFLASSTVIADAAEEELESRPRGSRALLEHEIERIQQLASEQGETAIDSTTIHDELAALPSRQARALYVLLHDPDGFRRAEEIVFNDSKRGGREWTSFVGRKDLDLMAGGVAMEAFKEALRGSFDTANVHVEVFERSRLGFPDSESDGEPKASLVQVTVYGEDRPNTELAFLAEGTLGTEIRRRVLDSALTDEPATGVIECVGRQRDSRAEMARLMATTLLGCEPDFQPAPLRAYDLGVLKQRLSFERDPEDRIEEVRVAMLRLTPLDSTAERITVESLLSSDKDIWTVVEERLGPGALQNSYEINQARLVFVIAPVTATGHAPCRLPLPIRIGRTSRTAWRSSASWPTSTCRGGAWLQHDDRPAAARPSPAPPGRTGPSVHLWCPG